jgi:hypothetical protein
MSSCVTWKLCSRRLTPTPHSPPRAARAIFILVGERQLMVAPKKIARLLSVSGGWSYSFNRHIIAESLQSSD